MNTRTKHTVAQDRLIVAEQRFLDVERKKSSSHRQLITYEQKQLEKRLSSLHNLDSSLQTRHRSISEANLHQINELSEIAYSKLYSSLNHSNQNLLSLPEHENFQRNISNSDPESDNDEKSKSITKKFFQLPIVSIIPPDEDN